MSRLIVGRMAVKPRMAVRITPSVLIRADLKPLNILSYARSRAVARCNRTESLISFMALNRQKSA